MIQKQLQQKDRVQKAQRENQKESMILQVKGKIMDEVRKKRLNYAEKILKDKRIQYNGAVMRFDYFFHGQRPSSGYRLVIGFHGGGGCPFQVNEQQWNNHKHLYDGLLPSGTIWLVPRSAQQAPDMWWKSYIPDILTLLVQCFSICQMIDTNRVFVTGYSAGGDGVYHVAGMMADGLAGAAMMAGHPNRADVYNLRNIGFSVQVGEGDHAYDRANWGRVYIRRIEEMGKEYGGFRQYSKVHSTGHWMGKKDAGVFPMLLNQVRNPYPDFILFRQHQRTFKRTFYYIKLQQKHKGVICVRYRNNTFQIQSQQAIPITIMLNSNFIDFSKQIIVYHNQEVTVKGKAERSQETMRETAEELVDQWYVFEDEVVSVPEKGLGQGFKVNRPYQLEKRESSLERIRQMESGIKEDDKLHVKFCLEMNQVVADIDNGKQERQEMMHINEEANRKPRSLSRKFKDLEDACERHCQIY